MKKIVDYEIISFQSTDLTVKYVKEGLRNGWQPYGELKVPTVGSEKIEDCSFIQAMVKYDEES